MFEHLDQDIPEINAFLNGDVQDPNAALPEWTPRPRRQQNVVSREQRDRQATLAVLSGRWKVSGNYADAVFSAQANNQGAPLTARRLACTLRHELTPYDAALNGCRSEEEKAQVQRIILKELGRRHPKLRRTFDELLLSRGL